MSTNLKERNVRQFLYELESKSVLPESAKELKFLRMKTSGMPLPYCFKTIGYIKKNAGEAETLISVLPGEEGKAGENTLCAKASIYASREENTQDAGHKGETKLFLTYKNRSHPLFAPTAKWNSNGKNTMEFLLKIGLGFCPIYIAVDEKASFIDCVAAIQNTEFDAENIADNMELAEYVPGALSIPFTDLATGNITMVEYDINDNADIIKEDIVSVRAVED